MKSSLVALVLALFVCIACAASSFDCEAEKKRGIRVRTEWTKLLGGDDDRRLFINAVQTLKKTMVADPLNPSTKISKYDIFAREHFTQAKYPHFASLFFVWHRKFLLYYEDALRDLKGDYACITLPFWDWTKDSGNVFNSTLLRNNNSSFGGNGDATTHCVQSGPFAGWKSARDKNPCLQRDITVTQQYDLVGPVEYWNIMRIPQFYLPTQGNTPQGFWPKFEARPHANTHIVISGDMADMWSPSEPLFYLHHTMVDLSWTIWMDCHDYEKVPLNQINQTIYYPSTQQRVKISELQLDSPMPYPTLNLKGEVFTPRMMHNITSLGYTYDRNIDLITQAQFGAAAGCKFDTYFNPPTAKARGVSQSYNPNMDSANNGWNDLQQMRSIKSNDARLDMLAMMECHDHKANGNPNAPASAVNIQGWLDMMGGPLDGAAAFEPLC